MKITFNRVQPEVFAVALDRAWDVRKGATTVGAMLDPTRRRAAGYPADVRCYLSDDARCGYVVAADGDLQTVWSAERGRGDALLASAVRAGAVTLDCFDGFLPDLYLRHGFREVRREANWTPGGPDVVYMARES